MQRAIDTGKPYQTVLDPPPTDPNVAHAPMSGPQTWRQIRERRRSTALAWAPC
jgi:hypothetical protein